MNLEIKKELKMKEGLENLRRALGEKTADRKDIQQQIISSTTTIQGIFKDKHIDHDKHNIHNTHIHMETSFF